MDRKKCKIKKYKIEKDIREWRNKGMKASEEGRRDKGMGEGKKEGRKEGEREEWRKIHSKFLFDQMHIIMENHKFKPKIPASRQNSRLCTMSNGILTFLGLIVCMTCNRQRNSHVFLITNRRKWWAGKCFWNIFINRLIRIKNKQ